MKRILLSISAALLSVLAIAQDPGAVGTTNLSAWFKADGIFPGNLSSWTTSYPSGPSAVIVDDISAPFPQVTSTPPGSVMNYNATIDFNGNTTGNELVLMNSTALDLLDNSFAADQGTFFAAYYLPESATCSGCHIINYRESASGSGDGIQLRANLNPGLGRFAIGSSNSSYGSHDFTQDYTPDILSYNGNKSGVSSFKTYQKSLLFTGGASSASTGDVGLSIGARLSSGTSNGEFDGYISELIFYNRDLNATEYAKVHTYLAIKYGITLRNAGGGSQGDYVSTNGTTVWAAAANPLYHNDVIGIAREDGEGLHQRQSHSLDDSSRVYVSTLASSNSANAASLSTNMSYIVCGHNAGEMCSTSASNAEIPSASGIYDRLDREWRISNTNFPDAFNFDFQLASCAGAVDTADLRLLVDIDGDFTNAAIYDASSGLSFSYSGSTVTVTGISNTHIPMNGTRYMTIAQSNLIISVGNIETKSLQVYPNPASDNIIIEGDHFELNKLHICNILGEEVNSLVALSRISDTKILVDISGLASGIYTLQADKANSRFVKK